MQPASMLVFRVLLLTSCGKTRKSWYDSPAKSRLPVYTAGALVGFRCHRRPASNILQRLQISITLGNYKKKYTKCLVLPCPYQGDRLFATVEEKRTDVHIALQMLDDAHNDRCDRSILVSGDSDLVPAVNRVRGLGKEVLVYIPARDAVRAHAVELRNAADRAKTLPLPLLNHSHFPVAVPDGAGGFIQKPAGW
jgi:hypothetical protein